MSPPQHPSYPKRADIRVTDWETDMPGYSPVEYVAPELKGGEPDQAAVLRCGSHECVAKRTKIRWQNGRPLNPHGRTGISNRGMLSQWGPNHIGECVVTRPGPSAVQPLECVVVKLRASKQWVIPGAPIDSSELGASTLCRAFRAMALGEVADGKSTASPRQLENILEEAFSPHNGRIVYRGYADDARSTDHAWVETLCMHFHLPTELADALPLATGGEAAEVQWVEVGSLRTGYDELSAFHKSLVEAAASTDELAGVSPEQARQMRLALTPPLEESLEYSTGVYAGDACERLSTVRQRLSSLTTSLHSLGTDPKWKVAVASGAADKPPPAAGPVHECGLDLLSACDIFSIAHAQLPIARIVLDHLAIAEVSPPLAMESTVRLIGVALTEARLVGKKSSELVEANLFENLHALLPWHRTVPPLRAFLAPIFAKWKVPHQPKWKHAATGRADYPPVIPLEEDMELSAEQRMHLKRLVFVLEPPSFISPSLLHAKQRELFLTKPFVCQPTVLITVGAPGSGKSYVTKATHGPKLAAAGLGPPMDAYLTIDPDFWLTGVCQNDNGMRNVANYLNHESFMIAGRMRKHMIFDGTGKSLENTCGRVVSRLKIAGYRVYFCIVLASYNTCMANIAERRARTGRDVPAPFVQSSFPAIRDSAKTYVNMQEHLAEQVVIYVNENLESKLAVTVHNGQGAKEALALIDQYFELPAK